MSPDQRSLVMALVAIPAGRDPLSRDDFLRGWGASDGVALSVDLLRDAVERFDAEDVELALVVGFKFGFCDGHLEPLLSLAFADWHQRHEDIAMALGKLRSPSSVGALVHLAQWVPAYLEFDSARALATKAIWALGAIDSEDAHRALVELAQSSSEIVAAGAKGQLQRSSS
jgi:HEAT repeat protein